MSQDQNASHAPPKPPSPVDRLLDPTPTDSAWLSTNAEPFVPSFLRSQNTTNPYEASARASGGVHEQHEHQSSSRGRGRGKKQQAHAPMRGGHAGRAGRGARAPAGNTFSWEAFFAQMQPDDVEMLVELLPPDVQMSYYQILEEKSSSLDGGNHAKDKAHRRNRSDIDKKHSNCFIAAVYETFQQLSPEELRDIQETLLCASADAYFLDDGTENLFVHGDDEMQPDEEEWLMEQMLKEEKPHPTHKDSSA